MKSIPRVELLEFLESVIKFRESFIGTEEYYFLNHIWGIYTSDEFKYSSYDSYLRLKSEFKNYFEWQCVEMNNRSFQGERNIQLKINYAQSTNASIAKFLDSKSSTILKEKHFLRILRSNVLRGIPIVGELELIENISPQPTILGDVFEFIFDGVERRLLTERTAAKNILELIKFLVKVEIIQKDWVDENETSYSALRMKILDSPQFMVKRQKKDIRVIPKRNRDWRSKLVNRLRNFEDRSSEEDSEISLQSILSDDESFEAVGSNGESIPWIFRDEVDSAGIPSEDTSGSNNHEIDTSSFNEFISAE
jgi:hypothetical protein